MKRFTVLGSSMESHIVSPGQAAKENTLALKAVHTTTTRSDAHRPRSAGYSRVQPERAPVPRHRALQDRDQRHILVRP